MSTINDRVGEIMIHYKLNQKEFALKIDTTQQYLSAIITGKRSVGASFLKRIYAYFPEIEKYWLFTGEGSMFNTELLNINKLPMTTSEDSAEYGKGMLNNVLIENTVKKIPPLTGYYYPDVSASAGLETEMINDELKKIPISIPPWGKDLDFINVYGDSMYPKYCPGEIIGIKEVEPQYVDYGYAYVVILNDGQVFLKYVNPGSDNEHWILSSENPTYQPKEYHLSLIRKIFIIKVVLTKTTM